MEHHPPKRSRLPPDARRWIRVGVFTGAILLGLPLFPMIWNALSGKFPVFCQMAAILLLPVGLLALIIGICKVAGKQNRSVGVLVALMCVGFGILMHYATMTPLEQFHAVEYTILAALVYRAPAPGTGRRSRCRIALIYSFGMGILDEAIQYVLPNRVFDPRDIWLNWTAGGFGVLLSVLVHGRIRQSTGRWRPTRGGDDRYHRVGCPVHGIVSR